MERTRVMLVEPSKLFRQGLRKLLGGPFFEVVAEASSLPEAAALVERGVRPELLLTDLRPDRVEDAKFVEQLRGLVPGIRIVVLADALCTRHLGMALEAGVDGYLVRDVSSEALAQSLRLVALGEKVFPTPLASLLVGSAANRRLLAATGLRFRLTERELEILRCLLKGDSNKRIAIHLDVTEAAVKIYLKSLLRKIRAVNRTQAAVRALRNGLGHEPTPTAAPSTA